MLHDNLYEKPTFYYDRYHQSNRTEEMSHLKYINIINWVTRYLMYDYDIINGYKSQMKS